MEIAAPVFVIVKVKSSIDEAEHLLGEEDHATSDLAPFRYQFKHVVVSDHYPNGSQNAKNVAAYENDSKATCELD